MAEMNFGQVGGGQDTEDYDGEFLSDLAPGESLTGEVYITDLMVSEKNGKEYFTMIVTNHEDEKKWIISLFPSVYEDAKGDKIYGKKGGRLYIFLDSFLSLVTSQEANTADNRTVFFEQFKEQVNEHVSEVTVETVASTHALAESPNIAFKSVVLSGA